jgi:RNA polymerase sigma-70 factor (ECF subfamily)
MTHDRDDATIELLRRWHGGDRGALDALLQRDLPWLRERVRQRLGDLLREKGDPDDYVQEIVVEVLQYAPRFLLEDRRQFRALLARIVENTLRDRDEWFRRKRRDLHKERPIPTDTVLWLDRPRDSVTRPSQHAIQDEQRAYTRLAMELLDGDDRKVLLLREWDGLSFAEIGAQLGTSENAARMRFQRAMQRLAREVERLVQGRVEPADGG